jgi:hypothetical protein
VKQLKRVCNAARALSNQATFGLTGVPGESDDLWRGVVSIGGVILVEYTGTIDSVVPSIIKKLEGMSQKMRARLASGDSFPPPKPEEPKTQKMVAPIPREEPKKG